MSLLKHRKGKPFEISKTKYHKGQPHLHRPLFIIYFHNALKDLVSHHITYSSQHAHISSTHAPHSHSSPSMLCRMVHTHHNPRAFTTPHPHSHTHSHTSPHHPEAIALSNAYAYTTTTHVTHTPFIWGNFLVAHTTQFPRHCTPGQLRPFVSQELASGISGTATITPHLPSHPSTTPPT